MLRIALVWLAIAGLGACASLGHNELAAQPAAGFAAAAGEEVALQRADERVGLDSNPHWSERAVARASDAMQRRSFSPPSRWQPDQQLIFATALDRARRLRSRRRRSVARCRLPGAGARGTGFDAKERRLVAVAQWSWR